MSPESFFEAVSGMHQLADMERERDEARAEAKHWRAAALIASESVDRVSEDRERALAEVERLKIELREAEAWADDSDNPLWHRGWLASEAHSKAEVEQLRRWKEEAMPVMDGLQELGSVCGLRLGASITAGAIARVEHLEAEIERLAETS